MGSAGRWVGYLGLAVLGGAVVGAIGLAPSNELGLVAALLVPGIAAVQYRKRVLGAAPAASIPWFGVWLAAYVIVRLVAEPGAT